MEDQALVEAIKVAKQIQQERDDKLVAALQALVEIEVAYGKSPYRRTQKIVTRAQRAREVIHELRELIQS